MLLGCKAYRIKACQMEWLRHIRMTVEVKQAAGREETEEEELHS